MGYYYYHGELDYARAFQSFGIAERSQPNGAQLLLGIGAVQRRLGEWELSAASCKKAQELDPRSHTTAGDLGNTYLRMRDYTEAAGYMDRAMALAPDRFARYLHKAVLYIASEGNGEAARQVIQLAWSRIQPRPLAVGNEPWRWSVYRVMDRDYERTLNRLASGSFAADTAAYFITVAELNDLAGQPERADAYYDSARAILERTVAARPSDARFHSELGVVYAGFGRTEDAIREGRKAVQLLPVSKDAYDGTDWLAYLARIYVMVGEYDAAIE